MWKLFRRLRKGETPAFPQGVEVLHECPDATVDICFVHGLTGDQTTTWTAQGQSNPWPQTLLPSKLCHARILTYGYAVGGQNRLIDHATNFLHDLAHNRSPKAASRPIIFVAHDFGGLVCKWAILSSRNKPDSHLQDIFNSTRGVILIDNPHQGSSMEDWRKITTGSRGLAGSTKTRLLNMDKQLLDDIQHQFSSMVQESDGGVKVIYFSEQLPLPVVSKVMPQDSDAAEPYISISAEHGSMTRPSSANDGVERLLKEIVRLASR